MQDIRKRNETLTYPLKGPKNMIGLKGNMRLKLDRNVSETEGVNIYVFKEMRPIDDREGYHLKFHGPFEIVSNHAIDFFTHSEEIINFEVTPEMSSFDDTLVDLSTEE